MVPRGRKKGPHNGTKYVARAPEKAKHVLLFATNKVSITCPAPPPQKKQKSVSIPCYHTLAESIRGGFFKRKKKEVPKKKRSWREEKSFLLPKQLRKKIEKKNKRKREQQIRRGRTLPWRTYSRNNMLDLWCGIRRTQIDFF